MNILLLEPNYKCNYPPLGLMKLAYYHKEKRGDFVWFAKGQLPKFAPETVKAKLEKSKYYSSRYDVQEFANKANEIITQKKWDRVYVSTLFTYEWDKTIAAIEYAKTLVNDINKVFLGGILATLMPDELEKTTGIKPITGLLTNTSTLGFDDGVNVDILTPDYSILDLIDYCYPASEHYIVKATRGCGMKCTFCAVQTLEPECVDYLSPKEIVEEIDEKYGERRNLIFTDNNILKSKYFKRIIQDILDLGYGENAVKINPKTGKEIHIYVDFNQGLDMNFITEEKMQLISLLSTKPVRIAFDHISDKEKYIAAMELADKFNIKFLSNYMLYNTVDFKGKGIVKAADTPEDLYERIIINANLQEKFYKRRKAERVCQVDIYSFPMKFFPLDSKNREFYGTHWNKKMVRALQRLVISRGGAVPSSKKCFHSTLGSTFEEFYTLLQAPVLYLENKHKKNICLTKVFDEWRNLYISLSKANKTKFENLIACNEFTAEKFLNTKSKTIRKLYIHYIHGTKFLEFAREIKIKNPFVFYEMQNYITFECEEICLNILLTLEKLTNSYAYISEFFELLFSDLCQEAG